MTEKMTVFVDGKQEEREVAKYAHVHHTQPPKAVPVLQTGERMTQSITGEVHIVRS
jgi:hypothetical protein